MQTIEQRTKIPVVGTKQWEKAVLAAIASGKVKFTPPANPRPVENDEHPKVRAARIFMANVLN